MSAAFEWSLWKPFFITLTAGTTLIYLAALVMQRWIRSMAWRRTIWQIVFVSLGLLAIVEITGASHMVWRRQGKTAQAPSDDTVLVESKIIDAPDIWTLLPAAQPGLTFPSDELSAPAGRNTPTWLPGALWFAGFGAALLYITMLRLFFLIFAPRRILNDEALLARIDAVSRRLGMFGRVRVTEAPGLAGPIAFGIFRAGISLPEGFTRRFSDEQQDAMLAHELGHLAARDPFWHALADVVMAILWWHPFAWLAKHELRAATEAAADEASLVVENGPTALADCLVELGRHLTQTRSLGWLGMAEGGFRSGLGKRVKHLISLDRRSWKPLQPSRLWLVRMAGPLALVALGLATTVWAQPPFEGPSTLRQAFQRSVLGLALAAALPQANDDVNETGRIEWKPWSPESLSAARAEGRTVLVYFTADWAVTAQVNEKTSLEVPAVRAKLRGIGAVALRADYTRMDEMIANELRAFGRGSVPLSLVYPSDSSLPPNVLPDLLTPRVVLDALESANSGKRESALESGNNRSNSEVNQATTLVFQGLALQRGGKILEAQVKFREALKFDPKNQAAKDYLSRLQEKAETLAAASVSKTNIVRTTHGREALNHKLDSIRLNEVSFPGLPLNEVVEQLAKLVKAADPDGKGINFIVSLPHIDPNTGLSVDANAGQPILSLTPPLLDVTVRQALDAIIRSAERPLSFGVEDYAIVITPGRSALPLHARTFKIDLDTFERALLIAAKTNVDQAISDAIKVSPLLNEGSPGKAFTIAPLRSEMLVNDARRYFTMLGMDFSVQGKALVFNERSGRLMVRATLDDLDIIEQVIQVLNTPPPQVVIEVRLLEVSDEDSRALGLDWFLPAAANASKENSQNETDSTYDWLTNGIFRIGQNNAVARAGTGTQFTAVLTEAQSRVVFRALEKRGTDNFLKAPKMTMLSGRLAQIKDVRTRYIVTDLDWSSTVASPTNPPQALPIAEPFELGLVLDVAPYVLADGTTIQMTMIPTLTEFLGYDSENGKRHETVTMPDGRKEVVVVPNQPRPIFRKRQMVSNAIVWDGQTAVLFGGNGQLFANPTINEPLREGTKVPVGSKPTKFFIFVTPTLVDSAGNRIHTPEKIPPGIPKQRQVPTK